MTNEQQQPDAPFYRRVSEIIRDPGEWIDFPQVEIDQLDGAEIVVHDVMFLRGTMGNREDMDYAIILFARPEDGIAPDRVNGREVPVQARTSMCGGSVFVRKMKQLSAYGEAHAGNASALPILGKVVKRQGKTQPLPYYDFV